MNGTGCGRCWKSIHTEQVCRFCKEDFKFRRAKMNHKKSVQIKINFLRPGVDYSIDASYCKTSSEKQLFRLRRFYKTANRYPEAQSLNDIVIEKYQTSPINIDLGLEQAEIKHHFVFVLASMRPDNFLSFIDGLIAEMENRGHKVTTYSINLGGSHEYNDLPIITQILRHVLQKEFNTIGADVFFVQHGGRFCTKEIVEDAKQAGMKTIYFPLDDPILFDALSRHLAPHFDFVLMWHFLRPLYKQELGIDIIDFMPWPDPFILHGNDPVQSEKEQFGSDIIFTGTLGGTPWRQERYPYLKAFYENGLNVRYFGFTNNINDDVFRKIYGGRLQSNEHHNIVHRSAKIAFSIGHQGYGGYWKNNESPVTSHVFDASAAGILVLTDDFDDLRMAYNSDEIVVYRDIKDAIEKAEYYASHHDERVSIAQKGRERCLKDHGLDSRVRQIEAILDSGL